MSIGGRCFSLYEYVLECVCVNGCDCRPDGRNILRMCIRRPADKLLGLFYIHICIILTA